MSLTEQILAAGDASSSDGLRRFLPLLPFLGRKLSQYPFEILSGSADTDPNIVLVDYVPPAAAPEAGLTLYNLGPAPASAPDVASTQGQQAFLRTCDAWTSHHIMKHRDEHRHIADV